MTFADMMMLLLTFFVLLLALSSIDLMRYERALYSIQHAFGKVFHQVGRGGGDPEILYGADSGQQLPESNNAVGSEGPYDKVELLDHIVVLREDPIGALQQRLGESFIQEIAQHQIVLERRSYGVAVRFAEQISFQSGDNKISGDFIPLLRRLAETLNGAGYTVIIEGHTDDVPMMSAAFSSNWALSAARAAAVAEYMVQVVGLQPERVIAQGRGESVPIAPNDTVANRALNRRVELIISPIMVAGDEAKPFEVVIKPAPNVGAGAIQDPTGYNNRVINLWLKGQ